MKGDYWRYLAEFATGMAPTSIATAHRAFKTWRLVLGPFGLITPIPASPVA